MADFVTFEAVTNREDWDVEVTVYDPDTGAPMDLAALTAASLAIRDPERNSVALTGALGAGVTVESAAQGVLLLHVDASAMRGLCAKSYDVGLVLTIGGATKQAILGALPVEDGVTD
jgi:hypothetical protein